MMNINLHHFPAAYGQRLRRAARATLAYEKFSSPGQINIVLIDDQAIKRMNRKYRSVNRITDIISFLVAKEPFEGDLYIGRGRSKKQARRIGHSWERELCYLVIHGVLHLQGYTDYMPRARRAMFKRQDHIFSCLFSSASSR